MRGWRVIACFRVGVFTGWSLAYDHGREIGRCSECGLRLRSRQAARTSRRRGCIVGFVSPGGSRPGCPAASDRQPCGRPASEPDGGRSLGHDPGRAHRREARRQRETTTRLLAQQIVDADAQGWRSMSVTIEYNGRELSFGFEKHDRVGSAAASAAHVTFDDARSSVDHQVEMLVMGGPGSVAVEYGRDPNGPMQLVRWKRTDAPKGHPTSAGRNPASTLGECNESDSVTANVSTGSGLQRTGPRFSPANSLTRTTTRSVEVAWAAGDPDHVAMGGSEGHLQERADRARSQGRRTFQRGGAKSAA